MRPVDLLSLGTARLRRRPLESLLLVAVSAVAVALVVALAALLRGLQDTVAARVRHLGLDVVRVTGPRLDDGDQAALAAVSPRPLRVVPFGGIPCLARADDGPRAAALVAATTPAFAALFDLPLAAGRFLDAGDARREPPACVLDGRLARRLYGAADPLGQRLKLRLGPHGADLVVRGVMVDLTAGEPLGLEGELSTRMIYVHREALTRRFGVADGLLLLQAPPGQSRALAASLRRIARPRGLEVATAHRWVRNNREFAVMMDGLGLALAIVTVISGVLSVTVLQLVALRGRTGELAIRVTQGASGRAIAAQVVVESVLLTGTGALLGLPLAAALAQQLSTRLVGWPVVFSPQLMAVAVASTLAAGVLAALAPAWRAARLDPVRGLRAAAGPGS